MGDDGTGRLARVTGHRVGGKTGTYEGAAMFAGVAPLDAPRYVIVVRAEIAGDAYGGSVAAPVFARIATRLLDRGRRLAPSERRRDTKRVKSGNVSRSRPTTGTFDLHRSEQGALTS